ncbi:MAG: hypothetical protein ACJ8DI_31025 [Ktedonobacteraceae bacterium]
MPIIGWFFWSVFFIFYVMCLFTVCLYTFRKGHIVLGIIGIFFPFLWLIGAVLPAKPGSQFEVDQQMRMQEQIEQMTR